MIALYVVPVLELDKVCSIVVDWNHLAASACTEFLALRLGFSPIDSRKTECAGKPEILQNRWAADAENGRHTSYCTNLLVVSYNVVYVMLKHA